MSAASQTRIFGIQLGIDPKILVGALVLLAGFMFWYNSRGGDDERGPNTPTSRPTDATTVSPVTASRTTRAPRIASNTQNDHSVLRLKPVDATRGDIDPTLRLGLLERLRAVKPVEGSRNLFEGGDAAVMAGNLPRVPQGPKIVPRMEAPSVPMMTPAAPAFNIPLKYYGFVRPAGAAKDGNRGFFMDGDNILVGSEGDVLEQRYLIVALTPNSARMEDVQLKQGQEVQVTPEAAAQ